MDDFRDAMNRWLDQEMRRLSDLREATCVDAAIKLAAEDGEHGVSDPRALLAHSWLMDPEKFGVSLEGKRPAEPLAVDDCSASPL